MKNWMLILILTLSLQGCFTNWSKKDKALYTGFAALNVIDGVQTFDAFDDSNKRELNPLMPNKESVVLVKLLSLGIVYWAADTCPKHRTAILGFCDGILGGVITWNATVD